ncbi:BQ2448_3133 [Microbotryum intermedium]|uniref:BQ2448_3133 protein n=1 Tax=Microbotryum intermedium TaxID=269621 RepID=A0A238FED7_9BASI|nr:BQ2448_3133 [Microbotryum intermedium]
MGVHGLTSFVNKQQPRLSKTHVHTAPTEQDTPIPFVVDGLAFVAYVLLSSVGSVTLDGARGGNYTAIRRYVKRIIDYLRAAALEPEFVWDGAHSVSKLPTIKERTEQKIAAVREFMSSDACVRAQADKISDATGSPLLARSTFVYVLNEMNVKMHFASGEADSPTAELAQRRNAYAVSSDSDFFVFPAEYRGYVPVHTIRYGHNRSALLEQAHSSASPRVEFEVFQPTRIAESLNLPLQRLPIFASLAGNDLADYYKYFRCASRPNQYGRVWVNHRVIAGALSSIRYNSSTHESALRKVLPSLMMPTTAKVPWEKMVSDLTASAAAYALQAVEDSGPEFRLSPRSSDTPDQAACRKLYREKALGCGNLTTIILQAIQTGIVVPNALLEEPKMPSTAVTMGCPLRKMIYAVLDDAIGLGRSSIEEYCRQGGYLQSARIAISRLGSLVDEFESTWTSPIVLAPEHERVRFLCALLRYEGCGIPLRSNQAWPYFSLVLVLRHIQRHATSKWTKAALLAALATALIVKLQPTYDRISDEIKLPAAAPLNHLHRSAELLHTSHSLQCLMEVLLLCDRMVPLHITYDGSMLHRLWSLGDGLMEKLGKYLTESQLDLIDELMGIVDEERD